ncbi:MAG: nickel-responsive transcriptional regulator NikR [Desulfobacterota bacterium]|nr:nickel-responsive transcriptional regulator NikR [Thermodesulfobacteriota bacterium]
MSSLVRFGVSLDKSLLEAFDALIHNTGDSNRSEALRDLIREELVRREWREGRIVAGAITVVYGHHTRELVQRLISIQHDAGDIIISSQHVHLDHDNCLEVIVVKGTPQAVEALASRIKATRGVKHCLLSMTTTGKHLV